VRAWKVRKKEYCAGVLACSPDLPGLRDELQVTTTAVKVLLVLHGELHSQGGGCGVRGVLNAVELISSDEGPGCPYLHHQILARVVHCLRHLRVYGRKLAILGGLDALVHLLVPEPLARGQLKLARSALRLLPGRLLPTRLPGGRCARDTAQQQPQQSLHALLAHASRGKTGTRAALAENLPPDTACRRLILGGHVSEWLPYAGKTRGARGITHSRRSP